MKSFLNLAKSQNETVFETEKNFKTIVVVVVAVVVVFGKPYEECWCSNCQRRSDAFVDDDYDDDDDQNAPSLVPLKR